MRPKGDFPTVLVALGAVAVGVDLRIGKLVPVRKNVIVTGVPLLLADGAKVRLRSGEP